MAIEIQKRLYSVDELYQINSHSEQQYELSNGELVEVAPVGDPQGGCTSNIITDLTNFNRIHKLGRVRNETGYNLSSNTSRGPDVSFYSRDKISLAEANHEKSYLNFAPDLVVEVTSPKDTVAGMEQKIKEYLAAGVRLIWIVYPKRQTVTVIRPNEPRITLSRANGDFLDGYDVLPGFKMSLDTVFEMD